MENNKIYFNPSPISLSHNVASPNPAKSYIPEWYKSIQRFHNINEYDSELNCSPVGTVKACMPIFDSFTNGYIQETWCDIEVVNNKIYGLQVNFDKEMQILSSRDRTQDKQNRVPITDEFYDVEFVWNSPWFPKTPEGWSVLVTHPLNRYELPFLTFSGFVESDLYFQAGRIPFFIKRGFSGVIPKGTPMYQFIPIKRSNWDNEELSKDYYENHPHEHKSGWYKDKHWQKKIFE